MITLSRTCRPISKTDQSTADPGKSEPLTFSLWIRRIVQNFINQEPCIGIFFELEIYQRSNGKMGFFIST